MLLIALKEATDLSESMRAKSSEAFLDSMHAMLLLHKVRFLGDSRGHQLSGRPTHPDSGRQCVQAGSQKRQERVCSGCS